MELEKVKKRRVEREHERDEREREREMLQRDKEAEYHCQWEKQEDNVSNKELHNLRTLRTQSLNDIEIIFLVSLEPSKTSLKNSNWGRKR